MPKFLSPKNKFLISMALNMLFMQTNYAQAEIINFSAEICSEESRRLATFLDKYTRFLKDPEFLEQNKATSPSARKQLVMQMTAIMAEGNDKNFERWSEHEKKQTDPMWKQWSMYQKIIGYDLGEKAVQLLSRDQGLTLAKYEQLLLGGCLEKWGNAYSVELKKPNTSALNQSKTIESTTINNYTANQQVTPPLPMGQQINKCQQDGGSLTCLNRPSGPQMPRQGMTPYQ